MMSMGQRIRARRMQLGISQAALAERVCISQSFLQHLELDQVVPLPAGLSAEGLLAAMKKALQVPDDQGLYKALAPLDGIEPSQETEAHPGTMIYIDLGKLRDKIRDHVTDAPVRRALINDIVLSIAKGEL